MNSTGLHVQWCLHRSTAGAVGVGLVRVGFSTDFTDGKYDAEIPNTPHRRELLTVVPCSPSAVSQPFLQVSDKIGVVA